MTKKHYCSIHRWTVDGREIRTGSEPNYSLVEGNLLIKNPHVVNHRGVYQCFATNALGTIVSRQAQVQFACEKILCCFLIPQLNLEVGFNSQWRAQRQDNKSSFGENFISWECGTRADICPPVSPVIWLVSVLKPCNDWYFSPLFILAQHISWKGGSDMWSWAGREHSCAPSLCSPAWWSHSSH